MTTVQVKQNQDDKLSKQLRNLAISKVIALAITIIALIVINSDKIG